MTPSDYKPSEAAVKKVMQETGMDQLQAYRHLQSRMYLQGLSLREIRSLWHSRDPEKTR